MRMRYWKALINLTGQELENDRKCRVKYYNNRTTSFIAICIICVQTHVLKRLRNMACATEERLPKVPRGWGSISRFQD